MGDGNSRMKTRRGGQVTRPKNGRPPTPWQVAKPVIRAAFAPAFRDRGFPNPGTTMWRRRHEFVDVVRLGSRYGVECNAYFGSHPAALVTIEGRLRVWSCMFRTMGAHSFRIPTDISSMTSAVQLELLPSVLQVVDTWFTQFTSLEAAISCLEDRPLEVSSCSKNSPFYEQALAGLHSCIRQRKLKTQGQ